MKLSSNKYKKGKLHDTLCDINITRPKNKMKKIIVNILCKKEYKIGNGKTK